MVVYPHVGQRLDSFQNAFGEKGNRLQEKRMPDRKIYVVRAEKRIGAQFDFKADVSPGKKGLRLQKFYRNKF